MTRQCKKLGNISFSYLFFLCWSQKVYSNIFEAETGLTFKRYVGLNNTSTDLSSQTQRGDGPQTAWTGDRTAEK